jgi:hypothetical protein
MNWKSADCLDAAQGELPKCSIFATAQTQGTRSLPIGSYQHHARVVIRRPPRTHQKCLASIALESGIPELTADTKISVTEVEHADGWAACLRKLLVC